MSVAAEQLGQTDRWLGIYDALPFPDYRGAPGINKSGLDLLHRSPLHYIMQKENPKPPTPAMLLGSAFHCLVLEPDTFADQYTCIPPDAPRRPTTAQRNAKKPSGETLEAIAFWEKFEAENSDKIIINTKAKDDTVWGVSDWDTIHRMRDAVIAHPIASVLIEGAVEQSMWWVDKETHKLCKGRLDVYNEAHNLLVDVKTTVDASYSGFQRSVHAYRYHVQAAFYTDGAIACDMDVNNGFAFVCVEKEPPYGVACYFLEKDWIRMGREIYCRDLVRYKECHESGEWPGYPIHIRDLVAPGYAKFHPIS